MAMGGSTVRSIGGSVEVIAVHVCEKNGFFVLYIKISFVVLSASYVILVGLRRVFSFRLKACSL